MAVVPICFKMPYKNLNIQTQISTSSPKGCVMCDSSAFQHESRFLCSNSNVLSKIWQMMKKAKRAGSVSKRATINLSAMHFHNMNAVPALQKVWSIEAEDRHMVSYSSKSRTCEKQLKLLDSYFERLEGDTNVSPSVSCEQAEELLGDSGPISSKKELDSLNSYLGKLSKEATMDKYMLDIDEQPTEKNGVSTQYSVTKVSLRGQKEKMRARMKLGKQRIPESSQSFENEETSNLYLISILASINIAVFLFEIASPVKNSELQLFSLPLLYGAKINDLILVGEWWRLVTPMFLHSGVFHVSLGCWSLLTFGPRVCRGYGSFTFFLIYILGGIFGNLTSYLHTPEPTVGGTGPIFALIGAWLIYQTQNKAVVPKDVSESLFQKAMITTGLCFILSHFGPIDDWTHLGSAFTGIVYGFFTCPMLQFDDASSRSSQDEGIALIRRYADPCKSLVVFVVFVIFLSCLVFFVEPPLDSSAPDDFI